MYLRHLQLKVQFQILETYLNHKNFDDYQIAGTIIILYGRRTANDYYFAWMDIYGSSTFLSLRLLKMSAIGDDPSFILSKPPY